MVEKKKNYFSIILRINFSPIMLLAYEKENKKYIFLMILSGSMHVPPLFPAG
jgi:hypothetical protein